MTARQLGQANLAVRHGLWRGRMVEWEDSLRRGVGRWRNSTGAIEPCALVAYPMRQESVRVIVDPLVEQGGNLSAQIGGAIESR
jgi:hypothetical protein